MLSPRIFYLTLFLATLSACHKSQPADAADWPMYGRTSDDHRFSPLTEINDENVRNLGVAWNRELGSTRGLEATPIVQNGTIYTTGDWSVVYAIDAKTGEIRWKYDPKVPRDGAYFLCCDVVNRGVALDKGNVYVATLDARLIALNATNGTPVWTAETGEHNLPYSITAAPRIADGRVIIGNAGSEYGVRGYVSAYDAQTGKLAWRTYTVPGDPAKGFESKALEAAAKTWNGKYWITGGGGTPWEGTTFDPALDLIYFGTGNPTAWYRAVRGDKKGDDDLYTASILALHAQTGELAWYFQTAPGDNWDYDATQPLMQADLTIDGRPRKVLMQANKNGFFYVLDRQTGEFLSGTAFVPGITWATGLDPKTGRPIETAAAFDGMKPILISPYPGGAHNWDPMAFNPATGFVYFSAKANTQAIHAPDPRWTYDRDRGNVGGDDTYDGPLNAKMKTMPQATGELVAWDPVKHESAWRASAGRAIGGGVLTTAGNLVFQGRSNGQLIAFRASDGTQLWQFDAGTGIMAPPVTYLVNGVQQISVMVGWGGPDGLSGGIFDGKPGFGRVLTFALGANQPFKAPAFGHTEPPTPAITMNASPKMIHQGEMLFNANCGGCHGWNAVGTGLPDLRYASKSVHEQFQTIVLDGARAPLGMPSFKKILKPEQVKLIEAYVLSRAH